MAQSSTHALGSWSDRTCHQRGWRETYEWYVGASSLRCGLSNAPVASATVGSSSSAPIVAPQIGQKALLENDDERHTEGSPAGPTHSTFSAGNSTQVRVREPECLRQLSQEQVCGRPGRPVARNLTAPQRQPPSYCFGFIWCWSATRSVLRRLLIRH